MNQRLSKKRKTFNACSDWVDLPLDPGMQALTFDGEPTMKLGDTEYSVRIGISGDGCMMTDIKRVEPLPSPPLKKES